jgi:hypothetical protein
MHRPRALALVAATLSLTASPRAVRADAIPLDIASRGTNRIAPDGVLGDWRRFTQLVAVDEGAQVQSGRDAWSGADDASFGIALARDDQALYVAAEIHDDTLVRTREHRADDDALILTFSAPNGPNRSATYEIAIYPGDPGNYSGVVRFRGGRSGNVPGAQVVEAPIRSGGGITLEAIIPWRAIPELNAGIGGARGRAAYQDCDTNARAHVDTVLATGPGDAQHIDALPPLAGSNANSTNELIAQFAQQHNLSMRDSFLDRTANIAGDAAVERIAVFQGYAVAAGPGISGGTRYAYVQFPQRQRDDLLEPALRDVTGDGRQDLILRVRQSEQQGLVREVLYVYGAPNSADQLTQLFAAEVARQVGSNRVASRATYDGNSGIRITFDGATGFTQQNYPRLVDPHVIAAMTPWSEHRIEVYRWNDAGQRFDLFRSEPNPNAASTVAATPSGPATSNTSATSPGMTQAPDADAVLRNFRQSHGIAEGTRPTFFSSANFAGDSAPELLQVYGRHLVLTGSHFMNGRSFYSIELPVSADADVLGLESVDVSDDGHPEAVIRVRRTQPVQVRGRNLDLVKEFLLIYSLDDAHRGRIFAAEIARHVGSDGIVNAVRLPRGPRNRELVIEAGRPQGTWSQQTYPFRDLPAQGFAPILLPWETPRRTYRFDGSALVAAE